MWTPTLFLALVAATLACRPDYVNDNGNCYKRYTSPMNKFQAQRTCERDGATLYPILSSEDNADFIRISNVLGSMVWIGASCVTSDGQSCFTDTGSAMVYTNFLSSSPNQFGPCVLYQTFTQSWWSSPCAGNTAPFVCKYLDEPPAQTCESGKWLFNGQCYWALAPEFPEMSEEYCQSHDGHIVSIHSLGEDAFVHDVVYNSYGDSIDFYKIGLVTNPLGSSYGYSWIDGTLTDYTNFKLQGSDKCVDVSINGKVVQRNGWFTAACQQSLATVCKKAATTPYPPPYQKSALCDSSRSLPSNGEFASPNYPSPYGVETCSNQVVVSNSNIYITFPELYLKPGDSLKIFNHLADSVPVYTLSYNSSPLNVYSSTTGQMRIDFSGSNSAKGNFRWRAITTTSPYSILSNTPSTCVNSPMLNGQGEFKSSSSTTATTCVQTFQARSSSNTVVVTFYDFYMGPTDTLTIYDGQSTSYVQIGQWSGSNPGLSVQSTGQFLTMRINQTTSNYRGFTGEFHSN